MSLRAARRESATVRGAVTVVACLVAVALLELARFWLRRVGLADAVLPIEVVTTVRAGLHAWAGWGAIQVVIGARQALTEARKAATAASAEVTITADTTQAVTALAELRAQADALRVLLDALPPPPPPPTKGL